MLHPIKNLKKDFPALNKEGICYLDSAATTHKPSSVLFAMDHFYKEEYATVHRAIYRASLLATESYENVREKVQHFIKAKKREEIVFTKGTTEGLNLLSFCLSSLLLEEGDEILLSYLEHHSNLVPWHLAAKRHKAKIVPLLLTPDLEIDLNHFESILSSSKAKILSIAHISNLTGGVHPLKKMIQMAKEKGVIVIIDGAQAAGHIPIDVVELDCDFYLFSSHKMYGPTGIGVLYGRYDLLEKMPPYQGGGDMIEEVDIDSSTYQKPPLKFEAGTPPIAEVIGLGAAIDYLMQNRLEGEEKGILTSFKEVLLSHEGVSLIGNPLLRQSILSFTCQGVHPLDLTTLLDEEGVAIRSGHLCVQPALRHLGLSSVCRLSTGIYTTKADVLLFKQAFERCLEMYKNRT